MTHPIKLSVLDLSPICEGQTIEQTLHNTRDLAQHAERLGYLRYWLAEHHNLDGVASSATSVLIGYVAAGTSTIRVGSGGVMLPNHAPLVIAEQFGTLDALYPGRIDLGLGRAPGTDGLTMRALRRHLSSATEDDFVANVVELQEYFAPPPNERRTVRAIPGIGRNVPMWILGSSLFGAQVAAHLGLPFAFASHFAPDSLDVALAIYRERFRPCATLAAPYAMVGVNVVAAHSDEEAAHLFTSIQQRFLGIIRNRRGPLPPPVASTDHLWSQDERDAVNQMTSVSLVGSLETVRTQMQALLARTGANELMVNTAIFEHEKRVGSYALLAQVASELNAREVALQA